MRSKINTNSRDCKKEPQGVITKFVKAPVSDFQLSENNIFNPYFCKHAISQ